LASFAGFTTSDDETALSLRYVLNHYEYISICIQSEIYDEEMLRKAMRRTVIRSYQHSKGYIDAMRELHQTKTLYQEFQWLAERWKVKEIDVKFPNGA